MQQSLCGVQQTETAHTVVDKHLTCVHPTNSVLTTDWRKWLDSELFSSAPYDNFDTSLALTISDSVPFRSHVICSWTQRIPLFDLDRVANCNLKLLFTFPVKRRIVGVVVLSIFRVKLVLV